MEGFGKDARGCGGGSAASELEEVAGQETGVEKSLLLSGGPGDAG